jgi:hypothetical protein
MIVLDSTSKSLVVVFSDQGASPGPINCVVAYWSIDSAGLWTPGSYETGITLGYGPVTTIILPAPSGSDKRVVENIWISLSTTGSWLAGGSSTDSQYLRVQLLTSGTGRTLAALSGVPSGFGSAQPVQPHMTLVMRRDGSVDRQYGYFAPAVAGTPINQNVH